MGPQEIENTIRRIVERHINPNQAFIFLFGSRASGGSRPGSDYDIGVFTGQKVPWSVIGKIRGDLDDTSIPVDVDIVDFSEVSEGFKTVALRGVKIWNHPKTNLKLT